MEKYIPTQEEITSAERLMTDEQKDLSELRVENIEREPIDYTPIIVKVDDAFGHCSSCEQPIKHGNYIVGVNESGKIGDIDAMEFFETDCLCPACGWESTLECRFANAEEAKDFVESVLRPSFSGSDEAIYGGDKLQKEIIYIDETGSDDAADEEEEFIDEAAPDYELDDEEY